MEHVLNASSDNYHSPDDYIGWNVVTKDGDNPGQVIDYLPGIANDNLIVQGETGEILIPLIADVIVSIDTERREIVIDPIEGLLDLNVKKPRQE